MTILDHKIAGASDMKTAEERVKCQLTKYQMCMGCLACESVCRFNALSVKKRKMEKSTTAFQMKNACAVESV